MADLGEDVELGEVLLILGAVGIGIYFLYVGGSALSNWFSGLTCLNKKPAIPGVTGPTQAQSQAPQIAASMLEKGGAIIASDPNSTDFDYAQPNGDVVQVRHSFWGQLFGTPVTYTTVPRDSYVRPAGWTVSPMYACCYSCCVPSGTPASAGGSPPCNGGAPQLSPCFFNQGGA